ncbi:MAG: Ig-like domain-containing protein [Bacteroidales bacterium]|jgi:hypothetical protein|nr:Ig-like domain-containing protein [Bacteroidales bacterium]
MSCRFFKQAAAMLTIVFVAIAGCKKDDPVKVSGISLDKPTLELEAGGSGTLVATISPADAENKAVTWSSSNGAVATVDQNGAVTAVAAGTATITVTTADGGFTAGCVVTVKAKDSGEKPDITALRYETVPYSAGEVKSDGAYKLISSAYDDEYNYYIFVLGHVNSVPLAYLDAIYYAGVTPISITYSEDNVTQESISESVGEAAEHSFTESSSVTLEVGSETGIGPEWLNIKTSLKESVFTGWDETNSRSFSNTYETSRSKSTQITQTISTTIGEHGEAAGMYRWSLFSTTDVYYYVVTDRANTTVVGTSIEFCARPTQYWEIDYDPDRGGSFGKTAKGELLEIPEIDLSTLPSPEVPGHTHEWDEWKIIAAPTCFTAGTEVRICKLDPTHQETRTIPATEHNWGEWQVTKEATCETDGMEVRTCKLDPSHTEPRTIPATGHKWGEWQVINDEETRICENNSAHKETLIIRYDSTESNSKSVIGNGAIYSWQHTSDFDIDHLKERGYTKINVKVTYSVRANDGLGSECRVKFYNRHTNSDSGSGKLKEQKTNMPADIFDPTQDWHNDIFTFDVLLDEYSNQFSILFVKSGQFGFTVGTRTVTVTAIK